MATLDDIRQIIGTLSLAYPNFERDKRPDQLAAMIDIYHRTLYDIDAHLLEAAVMQHITNSKWFPTVAELREAALSIVHFSDFSAEEAWLEVKQAIRNIGYYGVPQFSAVRIKQTVAAFGWRELCGYDIEQEGIIRAHFMRIYNALQGRERARDSMLPEILERIDRVRDAKRLKDGRR